MKPQIPEGYVELSHGENITEETRIIWRDHEPPRKVVRAWYGCKQGDPGFSEPDQYGYVLIKPTTMKNKNIRAIVTVGDNPAFIKSVFAAVEALGIPNLLSHGNDPASLIRECKGEVSFLVQPEYGSTRLIMGGRGHKEYYTGAHYECYRRFDARTQFAELIEYLSPKPKKQIAFWEHDVFPYVLSGELEEKSYDGFTVKGYGRLNGKSLTIMDEESAKKLNAKIEAIVRSKAQIDESHLKALKALIPWRKL